MLIKDIERLNGIAQHLVIIFGIQRISSSQVEVSRKAKPSTATRRAGRSAKSPALNFELSSELSLWVLSCFLPKLISCNSVSIGRGRDASIDFGRSQYPQHVKSIFQTS